MKTRFYFLISVLFLFAASFEGFAQDDVYFGSKKRQSIRSQTENENYKDKREKPNKRKIKNGYVFIDGKYIEPPYKFKIKDGNLFINGIKAGTQNVHSDTLKNKNIHYVGYPPCISESSDWSERNDCKVNGTDLTYETMMTKYYLKKFNAELAYDSLISYYQHYPNVKSFEKFEELHGGVYKIICYNGSEQLFQIDKENFIKKHKGINNPQSKTKNILITQNVKHIKSTLIDGSLYYFFSDLSISKRRAISQEKLLTLCASDSICDPIEQRSIGTGQKNEKFIENIIIEFHRNASFFERINSEIKSKREDNEGIINIEQHNSNKVFDQSNYSSVKNNFVAFCPAAFEETFPIMDEILLIQSFIEDEGYIFNSNNYLLDETSNDDNLDNVEYSQLTELCSEAGFLYVATHGNINTLLIGQALTYEALNNWCNFDEDVYIVEISQDDYPLEWSLSNPLYGALVNSNWINKYWKEDLENNNSITIISSCQAFFGIGEACAGGICFAYEEDVEYGQSQDNTEQLLKRMNGKKNNSQYRNAIDAYNHMILLAGFNYHANTNITLCPSTKDIFPANNTIVPSVITQGYFEIDTWCDATIPVGEALTFIETGDINITNVYWENGSTGKSNKIIYNWTGTQGSVTVNVHTDKILAYGGGGQMLDFDRVTPNGETGVYYIFQIGSGTVQNVDFYADNTNIFENTQVQFADISTLDNPLTYHWNFGDGSTSTLQNPTHIYNTEGDYDVTLTVSTPIGNLYEEKSDYISVFNESSGDLSCTNNIISDKSAEFYATYIGAYEPNAYKYRFTIDYGDGSTETVQDISSFADFYHQYTDYGIYETTVYVEILSQFEEIIYAVGCDCGSVELYDPFPCSHLQANFSISPEIAYLTGPSQNSEATVYFTDLTTGGVNYTWDWFFLAEPENGHEPSGGISHESGNHQSKTYNHEGLYPVLLHVTDGNGCTNDVTHYANIAEPLQCINNLKILSSESDQLWSSNRLIIPWQQENVECTLGLRNIFDFVYYCSTCNCDVCGESGQCYNWYINGENVKNGILIYYPVESGHTDLTDIEIESYDWLLPYRNRISLALYGRIYDENLTSINCYDSTNIEVLAVNCAGTMNSNQLVYAYLASNNVFLSDFSANGYMINKNSWKEFYSGQINLNSGVNQFVNDFDVSLLACNGIILSDGFKTGSGKFIAGSASDGATLEGCYQSSNFYYVAIDDPSTDINLGPELNITPNPVSDIFTIIVTHNVSDLLKLEIFDSNSRLIKTAYNDYTEPGIYEFEVKDFNFNPGLYFCRYSNSQQTISEKFIRTQDNDK